MDIQVASNFERLLWLAVGRDGKQVQRMMDGLRSDGAFTIRDDAVAWIGQRFEAGRADENETAAAMARSVENTGYLPDPHTAVAMAVADRFLPSPTPMVTLATAHPAKFPDAVKAATGRAVETPARLSALDEREEGFVVLANDLAAVERHVETHARAARQEA
jgi:threonine synthase